MKTPPRLGVPRASVLIVIVAMLAMLALMGTAFLSTTRTDLHASQQNLRNIRGDMAIESVVDLVVAEVAGSLITAPNSSYSPVYRSPDLVDLTTQADALSWPVASRVPVLPNPASSPTSLYPTTPNRPLSPETGGVNPPIWRYVTAWQEHTNPQYGGPIRPDGVEPAGSLPAGRIYAPTARAFLGQPLWPFLQPYSDVYLTPQDADPFTPEIDPLPAADADGDGIADSLLKSFTPAPVDAITYYYAARIIDNNSAVNVNTAMARDFDFDGAGRRIAQPLVFKGRVGLAEMLRTQNPHASKISELGDEMRRLNAWRLNNRRSLVAGVRGVEASDARWAKPYDDSGRQRDDFRFISVGDALERQLGSRLTNPGAADGSRRFRALTVSDQMALARRFCLAESNASPTLLEQALQESLRTYGNARGETKAVPSVPYSPLDVAAWMDRFNYDEENAADPRTFKDRRALLVTRNPNSIHAPTRDTDPHDEAAGMPPFNDQSSRRFQTRASINSGSFNELWKAYWSVMTRGQRHPDLLEFSDSKFRLDSKRNIALMDPYIGMKFDSDFRAFPGEIHPQLMFRSPIRDVRKTAFEIGALRFAYSASNWSSMTILRSALAAVNAEDLRDADDDVTSHVIRLDLIEGKTASAPKYQNVPVRVYGFERQPFITEIYVNTDNHTAGASGSANPKGYVAVELHNPYDAPINLGPPPGEADGQNGWSGGLIDRLAAGTTPAGVPKKPMIKLLNLDGSTPGTGHLPWRFPAGTFVPAHGYLVLENYDPRGSADADAATYRPDAAASPALGALGDPQTTKPNLRVVYVPHLCEVLAGGASGLRGGELVLLRTRRADGRSIDAGADTADRFNERVNLNDLVPVDQFDFTGVGLDESTTPTFHGVHYVRANDAASGGAWKFVYPGRYDGARLKGRHQGMIDVPFQPSESEPIASYLPPVRLGLPDVAAHPNQGSFPIPLSAAGFPGPNRPNGGVNSHPFGLFARDGDILQVPFIGSYTVYTPTPNGELFEINSITMDSAFAEDTDTRDDWPARPGEQCEQIGRFCPVHVSDPNDSRKRLDDFEDSFGDYPGPNDAYHDHSGFGVPPRFSSFYRYGWTRDLFDYLTVETPNNDFLPNVPPSLYQTPDGQPIQPAPAAVSNSGGPANGDHELTQAIEGRININTAPWKVLAALPLVVNPATSEVDRTRTEELAKAIVHFRDFDDGLPHLYTDGAGGPTISRPQGHGFFSSMLDLNAVVDTRKGVQPIDGTLPGFRNGYGLYKPAGGDFQDQFFNVIRLSNLITVRSDSFTCYVQVLGIEHAGTADARVIMQRRMGFILDRSAMTPERPIPRVQYFTRE